MNFNYNLSKINSKDQLLTFLGIDEHSFDLCSSFDPDAYKNAIKSNTYTEIFRSPFIQHKIPKRDPAKGIRTTWEVIKPFDRHYKATSRRLEAFFSHFESRHPHPNAYGYVKGRNTRENAAQHLCRRNILKCDIKDFFHSISKTEIAQLFSKYEINPDVADILSNYLTIGGRLPLGLPTSPVITNIICLDLDDDLDSLSNLKNLNYTRYSDDITISSNEDLPEIEVIEAILRQHGFEMAHAKTRKTRLGQSHYVTGLSVSDSNAPHAPRKLKRSLRQQLYYADKFGLRDHFSKIGVSGQVPEQRMLNSMDGMVKYISYHEPNIGGKIKSLWSEILTKSGMRPSFHPKNFDKTPIAIFVDETELDFDGKKYLALGMCATHHLDEVINASVKTLSDHLANPLADGDQEQLKKNGLHFADATEDLRMNFVKKMQTLPFTGYVALATLSENETYQNTYLRLLRSLTRRRLISCDGRVVMLQFEATNKVSLNKIKCLIQEEYKILEMEDNRRPICFDVTAVTKESPGVSLPDFLLGVLRRYLILKPRQRKDIPDRYELLFEYLRDKLIVLLDLDEKVEYSRRNPIKPWSERSGRP